MYWSTTGSDQAFWIQECIYRKKYWLSDHLLVVSKVFIMLKVRKRRPQLDRIIVLLDRRLPQEHVKEFQRVREERSKS